MKRCLVIGIGLLVWMFGGPALAQKKLDAWVYVVDDGSAHMSGSTDELKAARSLQQGDEPLFWFRRGGKKYLVRDAAVVARVRALFAPMDTVGAEMERLGERLGKLGDKMGKLGSKMERLGLKMARRGAKLARLDHDDPRRRELEKEMEDLGAQMESLQGLAKVYEVDMAPLSRRMEELGRDMERMSGQAEVDLAAIADGAVKSGQAVETK
jgi:hypothetical protein